MDWLSDICKGLALAVLNEFGKGITARTFDVVHPSGEKMKATVTISFRVPVQATIQQRATISRVFVGEPVCNISGVAVGTGSQTGTAGSLAAAQDVMTNGNGTIPVQVTDYGIPSVASGDPQTCKHTVGEWIAPDKIKCTICGETVVTTP